VTDVIASAGSVRAPSLSTRTKFYLTTGITFVLLMSAWELVGRLTNPLFFAPISDIVVELVKAILDPRERLLTAFLQTLSVLVPGFVIASVLGVAIGILMGRRNLAYQILDPYVTILYNTPRVVLIPIFMLWLGTGATMKIVVVVLAAIFPVIVNTMLGVRDVSAQLTEPARSLKATERQLLHKVIFPATLPFIIAGIKLGLGRALTTVIVAELFVSVSGLGGMLHSAATSYQTAKMFVPAIILALLGILIDGLLSRLERATVRRYGA
jgi:ABC-type nitrate/sulfonate/bicarbonate transport system permease component